MERRRARCSREPAPDSKIGRAIAAAAAVTTMPLEGYTFEAPWPPTVNHYWRVQQVGALAGIPRLSQAAIDYRRNFANAVLVAGVGTRAGYTGAVTLELEAYPPDRRRRDLDNLLKPLLDALVSSHLILDDAQVFDLRIRRGEVRERGAVTVALRPGAVSPSGPTRIGWKA
jgi:crossover junction endodeoxyribonuclease RusA